MNRTEQRLQRAVEARLEPDEHLVAWTRAWVSRYRSFHFLLALRNRDFAVVTDRRLMLWSTGFLTRQPKRRVLSDRLDDLSIESTSRDPGRRMACSRVGRPPLLLELGKDPQSDRFSIELRDRALAAKALQRAESGDGAPRAVSTPRDETPPLYEFGLFVAPAPEPEPDPTATERESEAETEAEAEVEGEAESEGERETEAPPSDLRPWP